MPPSARCAVTSSAFKRGARTYIDSNIFIYFVESAAPRYEAAQRLFEMLRESHSTVYTSDIAVAECLCRPYRDGNSRLAGIYLELFETGGDVLRVPLDYELVKRAAGIGGKLGIKLIDALHVASAMAAGCEIFVTNGKTISAPKEIEIVQLSAIGSNP